MKDEAIENYSLVTKDGIKVLKPEDHWWTVTYGMSGWFAVEMWINPGKEKSLFPPFKDIGPFPEPWTTGTGRYREKWLAYEEAKQAAAASDLPLEQLEVKDDTGA